MPILVLSLIIGTFVGLVFGRILDGLDKEGSIKVKHLYSFVGALLIFIVSTWVLSSIPIPDASKVFEVQALSCLAGTMFSSSVGEVFPLSKWSKTRFRHNAFYSLYGLLSIAFFFTLYSTYIMT